MMNLTIQSHLNITIKLNPCLNVIRNNDRREISFNGIRNVKIYFQALAFICLQLNIKKVFLKLLYGKKIYNLFFSKNSYFLAKMFN